jgi:hypothetical protein
MGKRILTKEVLATIPEMVEQRLNRSEIAERLGCTPGTLQTQCCRAGISLRKSSKRGRTPLILSPTAIEGLRAVRNAVGIRCGVFPGSMKVSFQAARSIG